MKNTKDGSIIYALEIIAIVVAIYSAGDILAALRPLSLIVAMIFFFSGSVFAVEVISLVILGIRFPVILKRKELTVEVLPLPISAHVWMFVCIIPALVCSFLLGFTLARYRLMPLLEDAVIISQVVRFVFCTIILVGIYCKMRIQSALMVTNKNKTGSQ